MIERKGDRRSQDRSLQCQHLLDMAKAAMFDEVVAHLRGYHVMAQVEASTGSKAWTKAMQLTAPLLTRIDALSMATASGKEIQAPSLTESSAPKSVATHTEES